MTSSRISIGYDISVNFFSRSGIARYSRELLRRMQTHDDVSTFLVGYKRQREEVTEFFGGKLPEGAQLTLTHERALGAPLRRLTRLWIARELRRLFDDVDVVHYLGPQKIFADHRRTISTVHDLIPMFSEYSVDAGLRYRFPRMVEKQLRHSNAVVCPSQWVADTIQDRFPWFDGPITVTPLAAGPQFSPSPLTDDVRTRYDVRRRYVLFVGRIDVARKNIDRMVEAWMSIPTQIRKDTDFIIITDRNDRVIKSFVSGLTNVDASVRVFNTVSNTELTQFLSSASLLLFASQAEGFGLPILEAMQCGCPVITSSTTSMTEVGGDAVLYVDPTNVEQMRETIALAMHDDEVLADLRERGFVQCSKFHWERTAELTLGAYRSCPTR
ncbi:MAG: glycosyltransferase family 4 protein [Ignavibacteria bacterium]|jgi:alpha-1,3-rhamnosyl/mannosyltransferase